MCTTEQRTILMDGVALKVGDRVWCFNNGWGTVRDICGKHRDRHYPLVIKFDNHETDYTETLKEFDHYARRTLFWDEIKFPVPPTKPKKLITVWDWYVEDRPGGTIIRFNAKTERQLSVYLTKQRIDGSKREVEV